LELVVLLVLVLQIPHTYLMFVLYLQDRLHLYVKGDVFIDGNLDINFGTVGGDLEVDAAIIGNLTAPNINSAGISTFNTLDVNGTIRDNIIILVHQDNI
jgi:hypothetical protein